MRRPRAVRPRLGTHVSVAGGVARAVDRAVALGCDAFQIFTRNPNQWQSVPLTPEDVRRFRESRRRAGLAPAVSHASYLINLATPDLALLARSVEALADELRRAHALGLDGVVLHPGTRGEGEDEARAMDRIAAGVAAAFARAGDVSPRLLLEHTAGQGRSVGCTFAHLAGILARLGGTPRVGVCLDTCHLLAAGYDIVSPRGFARTFDEFEALVGFDRLAAVHANDSKRPLGSRVDRHAHIGDGFLGLRPFRRLLTDRRFAGLPFLLETEKLPLRRPTSVAPDPLDARNLATLRRLMGRRDSTD